MPPGPLPGTTRPASPGAAPSRRGALATATAERATVALAVLLAYANALRVPFQYDDAALLANPAYRDLSALWPPAGPRWVADLTFALNHASGGFDPRGFHAVNVAIHAASALLVGALARALLQTPRLRAAAPGPLLARWLPLAAALLFALHPLATQAVTYVVQRYTSLAACLYLAAAVLHLRGRLRLDGGDRRGGLALLAAAVLAASLAMRTKEIAFTLPAAAAALELLLFEGPLRRRLALLVPLAATALLVPLGRLGPAGGLDAATRETAAISRWSYLLTEARAVVTYLRLVAWPAGQSIDHDLPLSTSLLDPRVLGALALLAALALGAARLARADGPARAPGLLVAAGTLWFSLALSVESSLIPIRDPLVEHRVYLPLAGAALAAAALLLWAAEALPRPGPPALRALGLVALATVPLGAATSARNAVWRDELTLWADAAAKAPGKARPRTYLGLALAARGRLDEAQAALEEALRLDPRSPSAALDLGNVLREKGDLAGALRLYAQAATSPGMAEAHVNLGALHEQLGRLDEAEREYREALRIDPALAGARANLAGLLRRRAGATP